jgi:putative SOS response-associated peptidase YedK
MCGRFSLFTPPDRLAGIFGAECAGDLGGFQPRWNIGPTSDVLCLTSGEGHPVSSPHSRLIDRFRWGLIPSWSKDRSPGIPLFNARAETIDTKPSFREAFVQRRAAVLADGFLEWHQRAGGRGQPHYFHRADGQPLAFAGLWETWHPPASPDGIATSVRSCTIVTTTAGEDIDAIHDRMPVLLEPEALDVWLDPSTTDREELLALLRSGPVGTLVHHPVDPRAGNVRHDDPQIVDPFESETLYTEATLFSDASFRV